RAPEASGGSTNAATGGSVATGGKSQGGAPNGAGGTSGSAATGGNVATGGSAPAGGSGTGGSSSSDRTIPTAIPTPSNGNGEIRNGTTQLKNEKNGGKDVWDFENQKIGVNNTSDCDDGEDQVTVFEVEDGVTVKNLIIAGGLPAGNGIVCRGNCTLDHVYWEDVCEDAATNTKDGATMTLDHVIALHASDKVFQHNAKGGSKTIVKNSYIADFGKLWRSCGDCTANGGPRHLVIDNVRVEGVKTAVAGANQNYGDTVTITDLFVKGGYDAGDDKPRICTEYTAVTDHNGESSSLHGGASQWNTATCKVSQSNLKSW
ncbi:MAG: pectate lyase, partial [Myxococcota bacterium]|nr:pectate lyase [Myxococcota bacterium]